jgi:hypothetical protein
VRKGGALEKWARVIMLAAAITVVVSVLLPWNTKTHSRTSRNRIGREEST